MCTLVLNQLNMIVLLRLKSGRPDSIYFHCSSVSPECWRRDIKSGRLGRRMPCRQVFPRFLLFFFFSFSLVHFKVIQEFKKRVCVCARQTFVPQSSSHILRKMYCAGPQKKNALSPFHKGKKNNTKLNNTAASRYHLHPWARRRHPRNFTKASGCPRTSSPLHATTESGIILINGTSSLVLSGVNVLSHSRLAEGDSSVLPEHPN